MDSINAQQTEKNHEDLSGKKAVERIKAVVKKSATCFFCTAVSRGGSGATRPMSVQDVDDQGNLWFLSANASDKNSEIAERPLAGGVDDPRITVIRVQPTGGYYWDNKHGALVAGAKMLVGAAIGKPLDDSIEGRVAP